MKRYAFISVLVFLLAPAAQAQEFTTYTSTDSFDDVTFAIETAIVGQGLVIDSVSHTGEMLERTKDAVGSGRTLFTGADVYQFCSASISRQVMEADTNNFLYCPYGIHVFELADAPGTVTVSHKTFSGTMAPVQELLSGIVKDALDLE